MADFSDCGPIAAFEKPSKIGRMMLLRHAKCDKSDNKYESYSNEGNEYDASDDDILPSLCSDYDPDDMDQQEVDDLELQLTTARFRTMISSRRTRRRSETLNTTS
jgi:hypothetical protein